MGGEAYRQRTGVRAPRHRTEDRRVEPDDRRINHDKFTADPATDPVENTDPARHPANAAYGFATPMTPHATRAPALPVGWVFRSSALACTITP